MEEKTTKLISLILLSGGLTALVIGIVNFIIFYRFSTPDNTILASSLILGFTGTIMTIAGWINNNTKFRVSFA